MTTFKANRKFPNPITVTDDTKSHTLALQQIIEALNVGQRRTREINSSYVRVSEMVDMGLIEIVGNQLKLTNLGQAAVAGGSSTLAGLTDVDLTGLSDGDVLTYDLASASWVPVAPSAGGGLTDLYDQSLNNLSDVSFYMPDEGDVLAYNAALGVWETRPINERIYVAFFFPGKPLNSQVMYSWMCPDDMFFPANFAGSYGHILTNPTATTTLTLAVGGVTIGTISISTGGVYTFATTSGAQQSCAAGQRLTVTNQSTTDVTAAEFAFTLLGNTAV